MNITHCILIHCYYETFIATLRPENVLLLQMCARTYCMCVYIHANTLECEWPEFKQQQSQ